MQERTMSSFCGWPQASSARRQQQAKDDERKVQTAKAMITRAMMRFMLHRLTQSR
jgi:hypothetical protein